MNDRLKPIIDSTYPAVMAGLCLTFLGICQNELKVTSLLFSISTASFFFVLSSCCTFIYSVNIEWNQKLTKDEQLRKFGSFFWNLSKWSFLLGIGLLLFATTVVIYILWGSELIN